MEPMSTRWWTIATLGLLGLSVAALVAAPLALPASYDWVEHTTSESGAQGLEGAWLARLGFVLFGLAVLAVAGRMAHRWGQRATALHRVFGVCMVGAAAFSSRSWESNVRYDTTEDFLHSVVATVMGFAFAFGVLAVALIGRERGGRPRLLDGIAVAATVVLPIAMTVDEPRAGLFQRLMFAIAYAWYARETLAVGHPRSWGEPARPLAEDRRSAGHERGR